MHSHWWLGGRKYTLKFSNEHYFFMQGELTLG